MGNGRMRRILLVGVLLLTVLALAACQRRGQTLEDIPTLIPDLDTLATSVAQTETAPPEGYRESVTYETVDGNLRELDGWQ